MRLMRSASMMRSSLCVWGKPQIFSRSDRFLEVTCVGEQNACCSKQKDLCSVFGGDGVAQRGNEDGGNAKVVEWNFVLCFSAVAVQQAYRQFGEELGVTKQVILLLSDVDVAGGLTKRIGEHGCAAKPAALEMSVNGDEFDLLVLWVVVPVVGIGGHRDVPFVCGFLSILGGQAVRAGLPVIQGGVGRVSQCCGECEEEREAVCAKKYRGQHVSFGSTKLFRSLVLITIY
jgi:hypothetical protein